MDSPELNVHAEEPNVNTIIEVDNNSSDTTLHHLSDPTLPLSPDNVMGAYTRGEQAAIRLFANHDETTIPY